MAPSPYLRTTGRMTGIRRLALLEEARSSRTCLTMASVATVRCRSCVGGWRSVISFMESASEMRGGEVEASDEHTKPHPFFDQEMPSAVLRRHRMTM